VTVLFADIRGSTTIGERLDPEAVRNVLTRFYDAARGCIDRHGGTVEKFIGDAVMAVFGVPLVHEDDALRGVRAAAELQHVLGRMNEDLLRQRYGVGLELRIGVNTGEVVAGDPATESSFVAGDAVNVGARLEQAAPPGGVLLGQETWESVRDVVEAEPVEPLELKGKSHRVVAYRLVGFRTPTASGDRTLVGRDAERLALDSAFDEALDRRRTVIVTLTGPPGIGRTQLAVDALDRWQRERRAAIVQVRCVPEGDGDPTGPFSGLIAGLLDLAPCASREEVDAAVRLALGTDERAPVVASALAGLIGEGIVKRPTEDAAWAAAELIWRRAQLDPIAILIDDAHWSPPDLDAVMHELAAPRDAPVVVLCTVLPEFSGGPANRTIAVGPLVRHDALELLRSVVGDLPANDQIVARSDGNPLFLIETGRMFQEADGPEDDHSGSRVPTSIRALISARLERLTPAEAHLLGAASTIGRSFALEAAASIAAVELRDAVRIAGSLQARDLLTPVLADQGDDLSFSHALVREVAYESLTKERRADLHERLAAWLLDQAPVLQTVLAHHLEQAFTLRCSLGAPGPDELVLAARAATAFAEGGLQASTGSSRPAGVATLGRAAALMRDAARGAILSPLSAARSAVGRLAIRLGDWSIAVESLEPLVGSGDSTYDVVYGLGVALTQAYRGQVDARELLRGRSLLVELLERAPTSDVASSLAGSWKGIDDSRALDLYRSALELDPGDPYALGNVLELEAAASGSLSAGRSMGASLEAAADRCRAEIERGQNQPWACYDLAKFALLAGHSDEAFRSGCLAVARSSAAFMVETSLASLEHFMKVDATLPGLQPVIAFYRLALAALFGDTAVVKELPATPAAAPVRPPVVVVAGGSSLESEAEVLQFGPLVREAMRGAGGTLVSGATRQGVSLIAGDVAEDESFRAIGYLPASVPDEVHVDDERYAELRRTTGEVFSVAEPLQYWSDVVVSEIAAAEVRLLAIGGGQISAAEYRMALALGARVGAISGSGGAASELLQDQWWAATARLVELTPDLAAFRGFLGGGRAPIPSNSVQT
jgi:class 3 adenylate cyclase